MAKVCYLLEDLSSHGGIQRMQSTISNELCKKHEITIIETEKRHKSGLCYYLSPEIKIITIINHFSYVRRRIVHLISRFKTIHHKYFNRLLYKMLFSKSFVKEIVSTINKEKYDIVIAIAGRLTILLGKISSDISSKTIAWERNTYEDYFVGFYSKYCKLDRLFAKSLFNIDRCIVLTNDIKIKYEKHFGKTPQVIHNARSFNIDSKSKVSVPVFVACGRLAPSKGFDLLIEAFKIFSEKNNEWKLTLVGDGKCRYELEEKIKNYSLCDRIKITGFTDNVEEYLINASVFLMPSKIEGFGNVIIEAFEVGLPIIAWDAPAMNELIEDRKDGILVTPYNISLYADEMLKLALNENERKRMSLNAIEKAKDFSIESIAAQWEKLFEEVSQHGA